MSLFLQANDEQGIDGEDYRQYLAPDEDSNCEALLAYVDKGPEENVEATNPHATDNDSNDDMATPKQMPWAPMMYIIKWR